MPEHAINAVDSFVFRGFDLLTSLAAEDADEAAHGARLPLCGCHDLRQRRALGALHQRDHFGLLVGAVRFRFAGRLLGLTSLLRGGLGLLGGRALALRLRNLRRRCVLFESVVVFISFLLTGLRS